jgi:hypothetical protein
VRVDNGISVHVRERGTSTYLIIDSLNEPR